MKLRMVWGSLALALLLPACSAQQQAPTPPAPTFRTQTELVLVPVVVTDKSGAHVPNLRLQDFEVAEDGKAQKIASFEEVTAGTQPGPSPRPDQYTNHLSDATAARRLIIIVLDQMNTPYLVQTDARQKLFQALSSSLNNDEPKALLALTRSGLRVLHDFTSDPAVLAAAVRKARGDLTPAMVDTDALASDVSQLDYLGLETRTPWNILQQRSLVDRTMAAFQDLAKAFGGMPGRKALIWVSAGFPFQFRTPIGARGVGPRSARGTQAIPTCSSFQYWQPSTDLYASYEKTYRALNSANIALYSVDVRAIYNPGYQDAALDWTTGFNCWLTQTHNESSNTLINFAKETGGKSWVDASDFGRGFRMALDDARSYYLLGYYLDRANTRPGWRKLRVKVAQPGVEVRARAGFQIPERSTTPTEQKDAIELALTSPLNYTAIPVAVRLEPGNGADGKRRINFFLTLAPGGFTVDNADNNHAMVEIIAALVNETGNARLSLQKTLDLHLKPESVAQITAGGLIYRNVMEIPAGEYVARFVVRDLLSGRIGSVSAPLKIAGSR